MAKLVGVKNKEEILQIKKRKKLFNNSKSVFNFIQFLLICYIAVKITLL